MFLISNFIGIFAVLFWILSIQRKNKKDILSFQLIASVLYAIGYLIIGGYSAALMNISSILRNGIFYNYEKKNIKIPKSFLYLFLSLIIILGFITFDGYLSLIPVIITLFYTFASWQNNVYWIRFVFLLAAIAWVFYNIKVGAYIVIVGNIFEIISGAASIIRYKKR